LLKDTIAPSAFDRHGRSTPRWGRGI
jgi:hypothetical protein